MRIVSGSVKSLTVRLLVARACRRAAELLGLAAAGVGNEEVAVVRHQEILDLALGGLVHVLLVEGDDSLGDCLADRVDLMNNSRSERRGEMQSVRLTVAMMPK